MFSDGTTNGTLILKTYLSADFEYDSEKNYIYVIPESKLAFTIKEVDSEYPIIETGDPNKDNNKDIDEHYSYDKETGEVRICTLEYITAVMWTKYEGKIYRTKLTVNSNGTQISSRWNDIKP